MSTRMLFLSLASGSLSIDWCGFLATNAYISFQICHMLMVWDWSEHFHVHCHLELHHLHLHYQNLLCHNLQCVHFVVPETWEAVADGEEDWEGPGVTGLVHAAATEILCSATHLVTSVRKSLTAFHWKGSRAACSECSKSTTEDLVLHTCWAPVLPKLGLAIFNKLRIMQGGLLQMLRSKIQPISFLSHGYIQIISWI